MRFADGSTRAPALPPTRSDITGLLRLASLSVGLKLARFALGIGSSILLARLLSIEEYGIYGLTLTVAMLLAIPGEAGMPVLAVREIARARADGDAGRVRGMIAFAGRTVLLLGSGMIVAAVAALAIAGDRIPAAFHWTIAAVLPVLLLGPLASTRAGVQRALGSPLASQLPEQIVRPTALILASLAIWLLAPDAFDATRATIGFVVASLVAFVVGAAMLRTLLRSIDPADPVSDQRGWLKALLPFSAVAGLQVALAQMTTLVLGLVAPPEEVALMRVATLASDLAMFATFAVSTVVTPQIATLLHRGRLADLDALVGKVNMIGIAFAGSMLVALVTMGPLALRIGFGSDYAAAYLPMCILAAGHLLGTSMGFVTVLANMAGRERGTMAAAILGVVLATTLSIALAPPLGATGAAIAAAATTVLWRLALALYLYRRTGIRAWTLDRRWREVSSISNGA